MPVFTVASLAQSHLPPQRLLTKLRDERMPTALSKAISNDRRSRSGQAYVMTTDNTLVFIDEQFVTRKRLPGPHDACAWTEGCGRQSYNATVCRDSDGCKEY